MPFFVRCEGCRVSVLYQQNHLHRVTIFDVNREAERRVAVGYRQTVCRRMDRDRRVDIHDDSHLGGFGRHVAADDIDKLHDRVFQYLSRFVIDGVFTQNRLGDGFLQTL